MEADERVREREREKIKRRLTYDEDDVGLLRAAPAASLLRIFRQKVRYMVTALRQAREGQQRETVERNKDHRERKKDDS